MNVDRGLTVILILIPETKESFFKGQIILLGGETMDESLGLRLSKTPQTRRADRIRSRAELIALWFVVLGCVSRLGNQNEPYSDRHYYDGDVTRPIVDVTFGNNSVFF